MTSRRPQRVPLPLLLLAWLLPARYRDEVVHDLATEWRNRVRPQRGAAAACVWLVAHTLRSAWSARRAVGKGSQADTARGFGLPLREAMRSLRAAPVLSSTAIAVLALGIGVNAAVLDLFRLVVSHPLAVSDADSLATLAQKAGHTHYQRLLNLPAFEGVAARGSVPISVGIGTRSEVTLAALVTPNYFAVLGVSATAGRVLSVGDSGMVAVISHRLWVSLLEGDPAILGRSIRINGQQVVVIGVAPKGFRGTVLQGPPDVWMPLSTAALVATGPMQSLASDPTVHWLTVIARRRPGVTLPTAEQAVRVALMEAGEPAPSGRPVLVSTADHALGNSRTAAAQLVSLLLIAAACALLVTCANLTNVWLARGSARQREYALRRALGASPMSIFVLTMCETGLLSLAAGAAALPVCVLVVRLLTTFSLPGDLDLARLDIGQQGALYGALGVGTIVVGILCGVLPAIQAARSPMSGAAMSTRSSPRSAARLVLIGAQVAATVVLLASGAAFLQSLRATLSRTTVVDVDRVSVAVMNPGLDRYSPMSAVRMIDDALQRLRQDPRIASAAWATTTPFSFTMLPAVEFASRGATTDNPRVLYVGDRYFSTLGIPPVAGRDFTEHDRVGYPLVAILSESAAARFLPGEPALGQRVRLGVHFRRAFQMTDDWAEVIAVVPDIQPRGADQSPDLGVYFSASQYLGGLGTNTLTLLARAESGAVASAAVDAALRTTAPGLPHTTRTLRSLEGDAERTRRLGLALLGFLGLFALIVATVGVFGVCACVVSQRQRELGIRIALGAGRASIHRAALGPVGVAAGAGIVIGTGMAALAGPVIAGLTKGVSSIEPGVVLVAVVLSAVTAAAAAAWPARRAAAIDPMVVLKAE